MGYSPWGHKELDMTEQLKHTHTYQVFKGRILKSVLKVSPLISWVYVSTHELQHPLM